MFLSGWPHFDKRMMHEVKKKNLIHEPCPSEPFPQTRSESILWCILKKPDCVKNRQITKLCWLGNVKKKKKNWLEKHPKEGRNILEINAVFFYSTPETLQQSKRELEQKEEGENILEYSL